MSALTAPLDLPVLALAGDRISTGKTVVRLAPTEDNILGPFHREGAPFTSRLASAGEPGTPLAVRGRVTDPMGRPIAHAVVDVWQADAEGHYDNEDGEPEHFHLRGRIETDARGRYAYDTVLPGLYELDRGVMRPRHVHYQVTAPGYRTLTTQLYFAGDPWLEADPYMRPSLVIQLMPTQSGLAGVFDLVLAVEGL